MSRYQPGQRPPFTTTPSYDSSRSDGQDTSLRSRPSGQQYRDETTQPLRLPRGGREQQPYANGFPGSSSSSLAYDQQRPPPPRTTTSSRAGVAPPSRPARSERRPLSIASPDASPRSSQQAFDDSVNGGPRPSLQSKLQRALDANKRKEERPRSIVSIASTSSNVDDEPPLSAGGPRSASIPHTNGVSPPAGNSANLNAALSAFAAAGQRQQRQRAASIAPPPRRARRGAESAQGESVRMKGKEVAYPSTPAFREIERVLSRIETDWPELVPPEVEDTEGATPTKRADFDAVTVALSLLDPSSPPERFRNFLRLKEDLGRALKSHIQLHYQAFDTSVSAYNNVLANLGSAQRETNDLRATLADVREILLTRRTELSGMTTRRTELNEMENVLNTLDQLKNVPDKLESLLSEKRFLSAVVLLVRSLKTISKPEMVDATGVADLRIYLQSQEAAIVDILLDELHSHLYLKSFYCEARWRSYARGQTKLEAVDFGPDRSEEVAIPAGADMSALPRRTTSKPTRLARFLGDLSLKPSADPLVAEPTDADADEQTAAALDGSSSPTTAPRSPLLSSSSDPIPAARANPEADSFTYIESLLESLACLGKLGGAIDSVTQRIPVETYNLVEATVEEVEERNEPLKRSSALAVRPASSMLLSSVPSSTGSGGAMARGSSRHSSLIRLTATQQTAAEVGAETLRDLFWTLYSKLDAVLQGFRVAYECVQRISERRKFQDGGESTKAGSLMFSLLEVWKPVQSEVRALLNDYLADGQDSAGHTSARNPVVSVNDILRSGKLARDPAKSMFRFADADLRPATKQLKAYEEELNRALKTSVPGLVSTTAEAQALAAAPVLGSTIGAADITDRVATGPGGSGGTHRLLVPPDTFNVSILFAPTWSFLDRVRDVMPGGLADEDRGFGGFLDDFVQSIFLPQLEDRVTSIYVSAVGAPDAFQEDFAARLAAQTPLSQPPVVKVVNNLAQLVDNLCAMLRSTPFHRDSYSRLILSVVEHFLQRCRERYHELVMREAEHSGARQSSLLKLAAVWAQRPALVATLAQLRAGKTIDGDSLVDAALREESRIENEIRQNAPVQLEDLITSPKKLTSLGALYTSLAFFVAHMRKLQHMPVDGMMNGDAEPEAKYTDLPLGEESSARLDALLKGYEQLADSALYTFRIELRLRVLHFLERAVLEGTYQLSADVAEPDPFIVDLNSSLAQCDECAATSLASAERSFVLQGLPALMDSLLISLARRIKGNITQPGTHKMLRNLLALQQNLRNLGEHPLAVDFRSRRFWDLIRLGDPETLIAAAQSGEAAGAFDFEEYEVALALICGVEPTALAADGQPLPAELPVSAGGTDRRRRLYNESLIGLHAALGTF